MGKGDGYPILEKEVIVYPNSTIINNIIVREKTVIGANSLLLESTLKDGIYIGQPAPYVRLVVV